MLAKGWVGNLGVEKHPVSGYQEVTDWNCGAKGDGDRYNFQIHFAQTVFHPAQSRNPTTPQTPQLSQRP
ncbi:MAG: hypothetical protein HC857_18015 [Synechococcales cyanobacterium RU_4_20]|nr:hypothetical protein [Synechococcales cyanobacterium RU_4_20]NJR67694.1 hypothetical protein [Synechococcales cyanobacterium CRU_2_2]